MNDRYRALDLGAFEGTDLTEASEDLGHRPELQWLRLSSLVVDTNYQREIGPAGRRNIAHIAKNFDWSRFTPAIVAAVEEDGVFAIVDGQHRSTAALLRGIDRIPCQVIFVDSIGQAAAFADINGKVTAITPLQIHSARLAAGDQKAIALATTCKAGGVEICRYPVPSNQMKAGQTLAVSALARLLEGYGSGTLSLALRCITGSGNGNVGMVRGAVVRSVCFALDAEPAFRIDEKRLVAAFDEIDFETAMAQAAVDRKQRRITTDVALGSIVYRHLEKHLKKLAA